MTIDKEAVSKLFFEVLAKRGEVSKVAWATKDMIYAWRNGITPPPIGDMLGVLFELDYISVFPVSLWNKEAKASWEQFSGNTPDEKEGSEIQKKFAKFLYQEYVNKGLFPPPYKAQEADEPSSKSRE